MPVYFVCDYFRVSHLFQINREFTLTLVCYFYLDLDSPQIGKILILYLTSDTKRSFLYISRSGQPMDESGALASDNVGYFTEIRPSWQASTKREWYSNLRASILGKKWKCPKAGSQIKKANHGMFQKISTSPSFFRSFNNRTLWSKLWSSHEKKHYMVRLEGAQTSSLRKTPQPQNCSCGREHLKLNHVLLFVVLYRVYF